MIFSFDPAIKKVFTAESEGKKFKFTGVIPGEISVMEYKLWYKMRYPKRKGVKVFIRFPTLTKNLEMRYTENKVKRLFKFGGQLGN